MGISLASVIWVNGCRYLKGNIKGIIRIYLPWCCCVLPFGDPSTSVANRVWRWKLAQVQGLSKVHDFCWGDHLQPPAHSFLPFLIVYIKQHPLCLPVSFVPRGSHILLTISTIPCGSSPLGCPSNLVGCDSNCGAPSFLVITNHHLDSFALRPYHSHCY